MIGTSLITSFRVITHALAPTSRVRLPQPVESWQTDRPNRKR
jgi:hypothetical protein